MNLKKIMILRDVVDILTNNEMKATRGGYDFGCFNEEICTLNCVGKNGGTRHISRPYASIDWCIETAYEECDNSSSYHCRCCE
jgi:hypothetical protein